MVDRSAGVPGPAIRGGGARVCGRTAAPGSEAGRDLFELVAGEPSSARTA